MRILLTLIAALALASVAAAHVDRVDIPDQQDTWCGTNTKQEPGCVFAYGHVHRDVIDGSNTDDFVWGKGGRDKLVGHENPDMLAGGPGNDRLFGQGSHDHLFGGKGNDVIDCGPNEDDQAAGGEGADTLIDCEKVFDVEPWDTLRRSCDWNDEACREEGTS